MSGVELECLGNVKVEKKATNSLAKAHSNLFIPFTLNGSSRSSETVSINKGKLKENLESTIEVYKQMR